MTNEANKAVPVADEGAIADAMIDANHHNAAKCPYCRPSEALSDEEIDAIASNHAHSWYMPSANARGSWMFYADKVRDFARAILAASSGSKE